MQTGLTTQLSLAGYGPIEQIGSCLPGIGLLAFIGNTYSDNKFIKCSPNKDVLDSAFANHRWRMLSISLLFTSLVLLGLVFNAESKSELIGFAVSSGVMAIASLAAYARSRSFKIDSRLSKADDFDDPNIKQN